MKKEIRKDVLHQLATDTQSVTELYENLYALPAWQHAKVIGTTRSKTPEIDTMPIIKQALQEHKKIVVPKTLPKRQMSFYQVTSDTKFVEDNFGILVPCESDSLSKDQIDLLIVPGVAFSQATNQRIGFGGGYYDRFLADFNGTTVSLVKNCQLIKNQENVFDQYDLPIDKLILGA